MCAIFIQLYQHLSLSSKKKYYFMIHSVYYYFNLINCKEIKIYNCFFLFKIEEYKASLIIEVYDSHF